jgi:hypothetical protein
MTIVWISVDDESTNQRCGDDSFEQEREGRTLLVVTHDDDSRLGKKYELQVGMVAPVTSCGGRVRTATKYEIAGSASRDIETG